MIPASKTFKDALLTSHRAETRVHVMQPTTSNTFEQAATVAVSQGSLTVDGRRNIWRQGSLTLAPADVYSPPLVDLVGEDTRLIVERGITAPNLVTEWATIATLQVMSVKQSLNTGGLVVEVSDPMVNVRDYPLILPWSPLDDEGNKLTTVDAIKHLVAECLWDAPVWIVDDTVDTAQIPPEGTVFQGARMNAVNELAKGIGAFVTVTPDGKWRIGKAPADSTPVAEFVTGPGGVVISEDVTRSRSEQYNAVPLRWEGPESSGLVFLVDDDPDSPTYWDGPFGKRPSSEQRVDTVTTQAEAMDAARTLLDELRGYTASVNFKSVHNPLIEPFDRITVDVLGSRETHVVDSISLPLAGGEMSCETRKLVEGASYALHG